MSQGSVMAIALLWFLAGPGLVWLTLQILPQ